MAIYRPPQTRAELGVTRSRYFDLIRKGLLTEPLKLFGRATGHPSEEITSIRKAVIAGRTESEIKALVQRLHEARKTADAEVSA